MSENLYGKAVIYTDADGNEWPATINGPLKTEGTPPRVIGRKRVGDKVTPGQYLVEEEVRQTTGNERNPIATVRTVNLRVDWGDKETDVTGVRRATGLDGARKSWRAADTVPPKGDKGKKPEADK